MAIGMLSLRVTSTLEGQRLDGHVWPNEPARSREPGLIHRSSGPGPLPWRVSNDMNAALTALERNESGQP
jgi:hypothetical protein